jgi:hypothetical protein
MAVAFELIPDSYSLLVHFSMSSMIAEVRTCHFLVGVLNFPVLKIFIINENQICYIR